MFGKLAVRNVKRQIGNYLIYFITVALTVALMFAMNNMIFSAQMMTMADSISELKNGLIVLTVLVSLIIAFVLGYATSFMLKLRKREFGMYLTLGMTRRNIRSIFLLETLIMGAAALAAGILLGLFLYQGLMMLLSSLMEIEFAVAAYSFQGLILTVGLVAAVFLLASLTSAVYLKKTSVYHLLHSDKMVEKTVRHPVLWLVVTLVSLAAVVGSCAVFMQTVEAMLTSGGSSGALMLASLAVLAVTLITFHIGLARSFVNLLLKSERFRSRGTHTFTLRQLSGKLGANAAMAGALAFLLAFAVIGANVSFTQKVTEEASLDLNYPFDINLMQETDEQPAIDPAQAEAIIASYAAIQEKIPYRLYGTGSSYLHNQTPFSGDGYEGLTDNVMTESDLNRLLSLLGREPIALNGGYLLLTDMPQISSVDFSGTRLELGGKAYPYTATRTDFPLFSYFYLLAVVPDEAVAGLMPEWENVAYKLAGGKYDAMALRDGLSYTTDLNAGLYSYLRCDYRIREYARLDSNSNTAVLILGSLYVAIVFVCLAMAILALKTLSGISEDKRRYAVLFRLGADKRLQSRTLFNQIFSFFLLPFALPLLLAIPTGIICTRIMTLGGFPWLAGQVTLTAGGIAAVMALLYLLYFTATYLLAKRAVVHTVV